MGSDKHILTQRYSILVQVDNNVRKSLKNPNSADRKLLGTEERSVLESLIIANFPQMGAYSIEAKRIDAETQGFVFEVNVKPNNSKDSSHLAVFKLAFPSGFDFSGKLTQRKLDFGKGELNKLLYALGLEVVRVFHFDRSEFPINYGSKVKEEPITRTVMAYEPLSARSVLRELSDKMRTLKYLDGVLITSIMESLVLRMSAKDWIETRVLSPLVNKLIKSSKDSLSSKKLPEYEVGDYSARFGRNLDTLREFWFANSDPLVEIEWKGKYLGCFEDVRNQLAQRMACNVRQSKELVSLGLADDHAFVDNSAVYDFGSLNNASGMLMKHVFGVLTEFDKVKAKITAVYSSVNSARLNLSLYDLILLSEKIGKDPEKAIELTKSYVSQNAQEMHLDSHQDALQEQVSLSQDLSAQDHSTQASRLETLTSILANRLLDFYKTVEEFRQDSEQIAPELKGIRFIDRGDRLRWERWTLPVAYARSKMFYLPDDLADNIAVDMLAQRFILRNPKNGSEISSLDESAQNEVVQDFVESVNAFIEQSLYTTFRRVYRLIIEGEKKYHLLDSKVNSYNLPSLFGSPEKSQRDKVRPEVVGQIVEVLSKIVTYDRIKYAVSTSAYISENVPFMRDDAIKQRVLASIKPREPENMKTFYEGLHALVTHLSDAQAYKGFFANKTFYRRTTPE